jgi:hypothetical protein
MGWAVHMTGRNSRIFRWCGVGLAGLAGSHAVLCSALAGEPIHFSSPKKEVDTPPRKEAPIAIPKTPLRFQPEAPTFDFALPPVIVVDPRMERRMREQREENKNWLTTDPGVFRDRFTDPLKAEKAAPPDAFKEWDDTANRVLGRADKKGTGELSSGSLGLTSPRDSERSDRKLNDPDRLGSMVSSPRDTNSKDDRDNTKNDPESAMKALFQPRANNEKTAATPGASLTDLLRGAAAKAFNREQDRRHDDSSQLLTSALIPSAKSADASDSLSILKFGPDQTRNVMNPVTPLTVKMPEPSRSLPEPLAAPNPAERLGQPKLPYDDVLNRYQTPVAAPASEVKARQMESLKLMSRPSVLPFPSRPF